MVKITKRGRKPGDRLKGRCKVCGAKVSCDAADAPLSAKPGQPENVRHHIACPELCGNKFVVVN